MINSNHNPILNTNLNSESSNKDDIITLSKKENELLVSIANTLNLLLEENKKKPNYSLKLKAQKKQIFTSQFLPSISIIDLLKRLYKYLQIEESIFILGLIYIDRLCKKKKIILNDYNIRRILIISIIVAMKFIDDIFYSNLYYSKVAGLDLKEYNLLEMEFLFDINFELFVDKKVFEKYAMTIVQNSQ